MFAPDPTSHVVMHLAMMRNDKVPVILGQDHLRYTYVFELVVI